MGQLSSRTSSIEDDSKDLKALLAAAKYGKWDDVWKILGTPEKPRKAYLINSIPEDRRWGVLQQAVYFNNKQVVQTLLRFRTCDTQLKAKDGISEVGHTGGDTAWDIATKFHYPEVARVLEIHNCALEGQALATYHADTASVENESLGLLRITLAAYKEAFHPDNIDRRRPLSGILADVFNHVDQSDNWTHVRDRICQSLYVICQPANDKLSACTTKQRFYETIVNVYTNESTKLYTHVNTALRRQNDSRYMPTAADLAIGPYILMFDLLLLYWNKLSPERHVTYRRMLLDPRDANKYQTGKKFVWLSIVSSSVELEKAEPFPTCGPSGDQQILFIIDNSSHTNWRPRDIEAYAEFKERERVYPAGAKFLVKDRSVNDGSITIMLKLLKSET